MRKSKYLSWRGLIESFSLLNTCAEKQTIITLGYKTYWTHSTRVMELAAKLHYLHESLASPDDKMSPSGLEWGVDLGCMPKIWGHFQILGKVWPTQAVQAVINRLKWQYKSSTYWEINLHAEAQSGYEHCTMFAVKSLKFQPSKRRYAQEWKEDTVTKKDVQEGTATTWHAAS